MKPVVVLIGRPNVGKSTLFNRLTRSRNAIVFDEPGLTRDRHYGDGRIGDRPYYVVDTGGIAASLQTGTRDSSIEARVRDQVRQAMVEADAIIFLVDARAGISPRDREIADDLRRLEKPVTVVVNKSEGIDDDVAASEFHAFGLGEPMAISAEHGQGVEELMERVLAPLPVTEDAPKQDVPRVAVIGRPNAGKSTLVNALLGEERVLVSDQPGTTRDSIEVPLERAGKSYILIDTAGVRRRARVHEAIEKFSVIKTLQALDEANVAIMVLDAEAGVSEQDATLCGYALERGRAMVVAVNKWDTRDGDSRDWTKREIERKLPFLNFARVHYISARSGTGIGPLFRSIDEAFTSARREFPTSQLNRVVEMALERTPPPVVRGRRIKVKYAHQGGKNPPTVVIHGNQVKALSPSYLRYLANVVREVFDLMGTPVRIECKEGDNPYVGRRAVGKTTKKRVKQRRK